MLSRALGLSLEVRGVSVDSINPMTQAGIPRK